MLPFELQFEILRVKKFPGKIILIKKNNSLDTGLSPHSSNKKNRNLIKYLKRRCYSLMKFDPSKKYHHIKNRK